MAAAADEGAAAFVACAAAPVSAEAAAGAEALKTKGNEAFGAKKFQLAVDLYSQAIALNGAVAAYYTNRSVAYLRTEGPVAERGRVCL